MEQPHPLGPTGHAAIHGLAEDVIDDLRALADRLENDLKLGAADYSGWRRAILDIVGGVNDWEGKLRSYVTAEVIAAIAATN